MKWIVVFALVIGFSWAYPSQFSTDTVTREEWPLLPTWCRHTQAPNPYGPTENAVAPSPKAQRLINTIGIDGWKAVHHYCWGLAKLHRSFRAGLSSTERDFLRNGAIGEIDYVLEHSPTNFILRPELLAKKGSILLLLGMDRQAEDELKAAIGMYPAYWPSYGYLADVYLKQGNKDAARKVLKVGLEAAPEAKGLKNRLAALK